MAREDSPKAQGPRCQESKEAYPSARASRHPLCSSCSSCMATRGTWGTWSEQRAFASKCSQRTAALSRQSSGYIVAVCAPESTGAGYAEGRVCSSLADPSLQHAHAQAYRALEPSSPNRALPSYIIMTVRPQSVRLSPSCSCCCERDRPGDADLWRLPPGRAT